MCMHMHSDDVEDRRLQRNPVWWGGGGRALQCSRSVWLGVAVQLQCVADLEHEGALRVRRVHTYI